MVVVLVVVVLLVVVILVMLTKLEKVLEQVQHSLSVAGESSRSVP